MLLLLLCSDDATAAFGVDGGDVRNGEDDVNERPGEAGGGFLTSPVLLLLLLVPLAGASTCPSAASSFCRRASKRAASSELAVMVN